MAESRYIDRAELFNRLSSAQDKAEIFAIIQSMPNADIEPKDKKGHWLPWMHNNDKYAYGEIKIYKCSECGATSGNKTNFCQECGADMRKDKSD